MSCFWCLLPAVATTNCQAGTCMSAVICHRAFTWARIPVSGTRLLCAEFSGWLARACQEAAKVSNVL